MRIVTRDDIQGIGDAASLMQFLDEKLGLPIPEGATLEQIARPFPLPYLRLEGGVAAQVIECQELRVRAGDASGTRLPFLIRFREKAGYPKLLFHVSEGLQRQGYTAVDFGFLCVDEHFRPFAFAFFEGAALTIRSWGEQQARIHIDSAHEIPADFFPAKRNAPAIAEVPSEALLTKIDNTGTRLGDLLELNRDYIETGCNLAFVIDESKREQLIGEDAKSDELIKRAIGKPQIKRWQLTPKYLIFIPSGKFRQWPWSGRNESGAEHIFADEYPAIHEHLNGYSDKLKTRSRQGEFYWELAARAEYPEFRHPKIVYRGGIAMQAYYDASGAFLLNKSRRYIPTDDLSLLAILNGKLFHFYAQTQYQSSYEKPLSAKNWIDFYEPGYEYRLPSFPVAERTEEQKSALAEYVQLILDEPNSSEVPALEEKIDALVYALYGLTDSEVKLIEEVDNE